VNELITNERNLQDYIFTIRDKQVMLDKDLALLYQVETKVLNQAVKRNIDRFPQDFRFQLTDEEKNELVTNCDRFKNVKHSSSNPYAFTEQGISMLSAVLKSKIAIEVSIKIIRAFVQMRKVLLSNASMFQRLENVEQKLLTHDKDFEKIFKALENKHKIPTQGIFYDGQIWDAYELINSLLKSAKKEVILIDNYIDDSVLTIFSKYPKLNFAIITKSISKQFKLDIEKYNSQYNNLIIKTSNRYHDRFLLLDDEAYHLGASLKDLGKKVFGFSKIDKSLLKI
jgi:hypothetical protein